MIDKYPDGFLCKDKISPEINLMFGKSDKYLGYCWWRKSPNPTQIKIYINNILSYAPKNFTYYFYETQLHELLHSIGHQIKFRGYSSKKDNHFEWVCDRIMSGIIDILYETDQLQEFIIPV